MNQKLCAIEDSISTYLIGKYVYKNFLNNSNNSNKINDITVSDTFYLVLGYTIQQSYPEVYTELINTSPWI